MKVYEIVDWKHEARHLEPLWATVDLAYAETVRLLEAGELLPPLFSIVEREVRDG